MKKGMAEAWGADDNESMTIFYDFVVGESPPERPHDALYQLSGHTMVTVTRHPSVNNQIGETVK